MLDEVPNVRQVEGEPRRRWFSDEYFDLIVWFDDDDVIAGLQLSYGIFKNEHAMTWHGKFGYGHYRLDDGEGRPGKPKASPILLPDGNFDNERISEVFKKESAGIEKRIADFVIEKILNFRIQD